MSADELKALLDQFSECWRTGDAQGAAALFSNNALYSEPPAHELRGNAAIAAFFQRFFASNEVVEFSFSRILIGDGEAAAEWSFVYTSTADNKRRHLAGIAFIDAVGSLIHVWRSFSGRLE